LKRFAAAAKLMPLFGNVRERSFFWTQEKTPQRFAGYWISARQYHPAFPK
jgi:hypothetical protein